MYDETRKDKFHRDSEKIFRIVSNLQLSDREIITWNITPGQLAEEIRENSPAVEVAVRTLHRGPVLFENEGKTFMERGIYADPDFFNLFTFPNVLGKPGTDSIDFSSISISETLASKLFGSGDPIGKIAQVNQKNAAIAKPL